MVGAERSPRALAADPEFEEYFDEQEIQALKELFTEVHAGSNLRGKGGGPARVTSEELCQLLHDVHLEDVEGGPPSISECRELAIAYTGIVGAKQTLRR